MFSNASIYVCIFREQAIGVFWGNNLITTSGSLGTAVETNQIIGTHSVWRIANVHLKIMDGKG